MFYCAASFTCNNICGLEVRLLWSSVKRMAVFLLVTVGTLTVSHFPSALYFSFCPLNVSAVGFSCSAVFVTLMCVIVFP